MRNWEVLVSRGRELVRNIGKFKWELGDLVREVDDRNLAKFAVEVNTTATILTRYKRVAAFWPDTYRDPAVAFSVYEELMRWSDYDQRTAQSEFTRLRKIGVRLTVDEIRVAQGKTPTRAPTSTKGRADYAKRLMNDPAVRREIAKDASLAAQIAQDREEEAKRIRCAIKSDQRNRARGLIEEHAVATAITEMNAIKHRIGKVIDALKDEDLTENNRTLLSGRASEIADAVSLLQDFLGNSDTDFEQGLALLLAEGN